MLDTEYEFLTLWFHRVRVNGLDILIVNDASSVVGVNSSNGELDLFWWIVR